MYSGGESRIRRWRMTLSVKLKSNPFLKVGGSIILAYLVISTLDIVYPEYIGVKNAFNLLSFTNPAKESVALATPVPPSLSHGILYIFGTTAYKIPILPAILAAIPVDLAFATLIAGASAVIGVFIGVTSTYASRKSELVLNSVSNALISFPLLISVIIFGLLTGFTITGLVVGIIFVLWAYYAQMARMLTLDVKNRHYIEAARASGASRIRIVYSHIIPNILTPILVRFSTDLATVIVIFSAANFIFFSDYLSLATLPEMGSLLTGFPELGLKYAYHLNRAGQALYPPASAASFLYLGYWWTILFPIISLVIIALRLIAFSDGLRKSLDPRTSF